MRERLSLEPGLTLDSAITLACQVEHGLQPSNVLTGGARVHAVAQQQPRQRRENRRRSDYPKNRPTQGCSGHSLPATDVDQRHTSPTQPSPQQVKQSATRGKSGHFSKVCCSAKQVREVLPEVVVLMMSSDHANATDGIQCKVHIGTATGDATDCELLVDTGSSVSIIPEDLYNRHFSGCPLTRPKVKLVTYLKENIPVPVHVYEQLFFFLAPQLLLSTWLKEALLYWAWI